MELYASKDPIKGHQWGWDIFPSPKLAFGLQPPILLVQKSKLS